MPPVTACDEPWPLFLFWHHHFWPKLAPSILNFCRRKRSFQWCPDQSDWPNGALEMHKNAQKVEWKTQLRAKFPATIPGCSMLKIDCPSQLRFLRSFLTASKPSRRSITAAKKKIKGEKGKAKEKSKSQKALRRRWLSKFWFLRMPESQCGKTRFWWQGSQAVVLQTHFRPD